MESAARSRLPTEVFQEYASVVERTADGRLIVAAALGHVVARRAASCVIDVAAGDRVLLAIDAQGEAFVLAVLTRGDRETTLDFEGDVQLRTRDGRVTVAAQGGVDLVTPRAIGISAGSLEVRAVRTSVVGQALEVAATSVRAELGKAKVALDTITQRVRRSFRTVETLDQVRARHIDYAAEQNVRLHGENTLVTGEDLVKVNADQIHLG